MKQIMPLTIVLLSLLAFSSCDFILETIYPDATDGGGGGTNGVLIRPTAVITAYTGSVKLSEMSCVPLNTYVNLSATNSYDGNYNKAGVTKCEWYVYDSNEQRLASSESYGYNYTFNNTGLFKITLNVRDSSGYYSELATYKVFVALNGSVELLKDWGKLAPITPIQVSAEISTAPTALTYYLDTGSYKVAWEDSGDQALNGFYTLDVNVAGYSWTYSTPATASTTPVFLTTDKGYTVPQTVTVATPGYYRFTVNPKNPGETGSCHLSISTW